MEVFHLFFFFLFFFFLVFFPFCAFHIGDMQQMRSASRFEVIRIDDN